MIEEEDDDDDDEATGMDELTDEEVAEAAHDAYAEDGAIEIDSDAKVSRGEDGAYVQAWVFVSAESACDNVIAKMKRKLREYRTEFDFMGGRGIELAEQIDRLEERIRKIGGE